MRCAIQCAGNMYHEDNRHDAFKVYSIHLNQQNQTLGQAQMNDRRHPNDMIV